MIERMREHPLPVYFSLVFVLSWSVWVPLALDHYSMLPSRLNPGIALAERLQAHCLLNTIFTLITAPIFLK